MAQSYIEKSIQIKATPANLWRTFTDPAITRQMGGEYLTDWKMGSSFSWKGTDGNIYTNGTILQVDPGKILQHNLFNPDEKENILSVITYTFTDNTESTTLNAREELGFEMTEEEYVGASEGWDFALKVLKEMAESL